MKHIKYIIGIMVLALALTTPSCKKSFLDETLTTARDIAFYKTDAGILSLANGTYHHVFCTPFNGEHAFSYMNYGTDEFRVGGDNSNGMFNSYSNGLASIVTVVNTNTVTANAQWDNLYLGIGYANLIIENAKASTSTADAIKKTALGEGYFFRAYSYLRLVSQYGAVPLKTTPSTTVELEFSRQSPQEVFTQIIADFKEAYNLLGNSGSPSKITKDAAAHYLAKAYVCRASEINDSWNTSTKTADLTAAVTLCDEVIANHPLAPNYGDLWRYTAPNSANENLREVILSAQFTAEASASGSNTQHLYYISRYDDLPQMQRDLTGDRPFSRLATTYYIYRIYDLVNDSRFWKSYRTKSRLNKPAGSYYVAGDLGIMYVINQPGDTRFPTYKLNDVVVNAATGKTIPNVYVAYPGGRTTDGALFADVRFPSLSKYMDGSRSGGFNDVRGLRDIILARSADTYLIAAEAKVRLAKLGTGAYTDALPYINTVRTRAEYKNAESRSAYYDGGIATSTVPQAAALNSYMAENSYYESNNIPVTTAASAPLLITNIATLPAGDENIISRLGYTSIYDRMLCLVLNERARELAGEYKRWEDLSRTKTLVQRAKEFNPDAAPNIQDRHLLRPIPQTFLDGIQKNGQALTGPEKQAMQNPGY